MTDLAQYGTCTLDQDGCTTCGDTAIPVKVLQVEGSVAQCEDRLGQQAEIAIDFVLEARPGDVLMVHMGVAIARVGEWKSGGRAEQENGKSGQNGESGKFEDMGVSH